MRGMKKKQRKRGKSQYQHLDQTKRDRIHALWNEGHTQAECAEILQVVQSTISRELRKKWTKGYTSRAGPYDANRAGQIAYLRRYHAKWRWKKINQDARLEAYIVQKLKRHWNPDEISGRMREDRKPFYASKTAIYEWLRTGRGAKYCIYLYSKRHMVKHHNPNKTKRVLIPHRISISERPLGATNRTRYGHYEGDTLVSGKHTKSAAAGSVIYERKAKFIDARRINNLKPVSHNQAVTRMLKHKKALSITEDNGIENTRHYELAVPAYFCDPYSSWQKGGVEHAIKMIRRFIPKGANLTEYTSADFKRVCHILNNKPRKSLGYRTPYEVMYAHNLFTNVPKSFNQKYALRG